MLREIRSNGTNIVCRVLQLLRNSSRETANWELGCGLRCGCGFGTELGLAIYLQIECIIGPAGRPVVCILCTYNTDSLYFSLSKPNAGSSRRGSHKIYCNTLATKSEGVGWP